MEDLLFKAWPIVERAASVAAALLVVAVVYLVRELKHTRAKYEASQEQRILDGKTVVEVTTQNTTALNSLAELIRDRRRR